MYYCLLQVSIHPPSGCFACCCRKKGGDKKGNGNGFKVKAGCCGCGLAALKKTAELADEDIVHVSNKSEVRRTTLIMLCV